MKYRTWNDEDLVRYVATSKTKSEVIRKLGLKTNCSGNFQTIDLHINRLKIDISHFYESKQGKQEFPKRLPVDTWLVKDSDKIISVSIKKRLIEEGILKEQCARCKRLFWFGVKLSLHLDHIDGNKRNCARGNLRLLCPNCHSQTPTYARIKSIKPIKLCPCGKKIARRSRHCPECHAVKKRDTNRRATWPELSVLKKMVSELGYRGVGQKLGVSDKAVHKHIKKRTDYSQCRSAT